jgi:replicative DNA helicase
LAKDLDKCFVALSQLSKVAEKGDKPTYNNIRGGGAEQAASDVYILYDEYFKDNDGVKWMDIDKDRRGKIQIIYAKGRYSEVGNSYVYFDKPRQLMMDWDKRPEQVEYNPGTPRNPAESAFDIF